MQVSRSREQVWLVAIASGLAALPLGYLAGALATMAYFKFFDPPVVGEDQFGIGYAALLMGGPAGLLIGSVLAGFLGHRLARSAGWPLVAGVLAALMLGSVFALYKLTTI